MYHSYDSFSMVMCHRTPIIDLQNIDTMMSPEEAFIATSIWPITRREYGSGRKKLNKSQRVAINLACNNDFTLIQGPPGNHLSLYILQGMSLLRSLIPSRLSHLLETSAHA